MLEREYKFFEDHKASIQLSATKRFVVIVGDKVVSEFDDKAEAVRESARQFGLGSFLVMDVSSNPDDSIVRFHSRVTL